jgi:hypothetical protein
MDELRRDVNEAFDEAQADIGDLGGVRERMVRTALAARSKPKDHRMQLAAGLAAILIAALAIATFTYLRAGQLTNGGPPRPVPSPTPLTQPLNVPNSTPVIRYHDHANFSQIDAMTWDGKLSGTAAWGSGLRTSNPAANLFGTTSKITDRAGQVVSTGDFGLLETGAWADDGTSICQMAPFDTRAVYGPADITVPSTLQLVKLGLPPRKVVQLGSVLDYPRLIACGVRGDRAVVTKVGLHGIVTGYWVVELSTGKIVWTRKFEGQTALLLGNVAASPDGQYVAENTQDQGGSATIYGRDGSVLTRLPGIRVEAFSWDGSLVVTDLANGRGPVRLVRWHDGTVVWTGPSGEGFDLQRVLPEPEGTSLAIGITDPAFPMQENDPITVGYTPVDLYVIAADGHLIVQVNDIQVVQARDIY